MYMYYDMYTSVVYQSTKHTMYKICFKQNIIITNKH